MTSEWAFVNDRSNGFGLCSLFEVESTRSIVLSEDSVNMARIEATAVFARMEVEMLETSINVEIVKLVFLLERKPLWVNDARCYESSRQVRPPGKLI
jgi:hypothetical protein